MTINKVRKIIIIYLCKFFVIFVILKMLIVLSSIMLNFI